MGTIPATGVWARETLSREARKLLAEAEASAERTVASVRCIVGVSAGVLFFAVVVPPLEPDSPILRQIPFIALNSIGFFALGTISYYCARPDRYRPWMTWLFSTFDLLLWSALMISAVVNMAVPGDYMVGLPPAIVTFAILALVSLRNNPWLQAYALAFILSCLVSLYFLAREQDAVPFAGASPDSLFQIPQSIIRIAVLGLAGLTLVYATMRTRTLLDRAVAETVQRMTLSRYLPPQLAGRLAQADEERLLRGAAQEAAVMFVDIRGFTALAEGMDPADLSRFLTEYRAVVSARVHAHSGIVDKFVGDSVMAVFGAPERHGDDAADAIGCAVDIADSIHAWNIERQRAGRKTVAIGIGAHWGSVFCGAVGDQTRLEFTVLGDTVNTASRLEKLTKEVGYAIVVSGSLLVEQAGLDIADGGWIGLGDRAIRGRTGRVDLYGLRVRASC